MNNEKLVNRFAEAFEIDGSKAELAYEIFLERTVNKLKAGETLSVPGLGFFQKVSESELRFTDVLREDENKLFEKIEVRSSDEKSFELNEDLFSPGVEKPVADLTNEEELTELREIEEKVKTKIDEFEILQDFDPYELALESESADEKPEEGLDLPEAEEPSLEEAASELDENLQKELEEELLSDFDSLDETDEQEERAPEEDEETEKDAGDEGTTEEPENRENEILNDNDLEGVFDDVTDEEEQEQKEEETKEEEKKEPEKEEKKEEEKTKKKKKSLFGFLKKKGKKDKAKKGKKEKKKKEKEEKSEGEEEAGKKKISKKLLIILIAVFLALTGGGVYYFFFMGDETTHEQEAVEEEHENEGEHGGGHGGGHGKESIEDSLWRNRKRPLTPTEAGEHIEPSGHYTVDVNKPHEKAKNESAPLIETELEDPLSMVEFPHEKKITNTIYYNDGKYMAQISSWKRSSRAIKIVEKLRRAGFNAFIVKAYLPALGGTWYRVRIGYFDTLDEVKEFLRKKEYLNVR